MDKETVDTMLCPFCKDDGFDLVGVRNHIIKGYCEVLNSIETIKQERARKELERIREKESAR